MPSATPKNDSNFCHKLLLGNVTQWVHSQNSAATTRAPCPRKGRGKLCCCQPQPQQDPVPPWTPVDLTGRHFPVHWGLRANLAHLAEQHPRNVQVPGSSPGVGFLFGVVPRCGPVGESWKRWGGAGTACCPVPTRFSSLRVGCFPFEELGKRLVSREILSRRGGCAPCLCALRGGFPFRSPGTGCSP